MKRLTTTLSLLCAALTLAGCANHYDVTLHNGTSFRTSTRPKLNDRGYYLIKDANGQTVEVNSMRVRKIEAVSPGDRPTSDFN